MVKVKIMEEQHYGEEFINLTTMCRICLGPGEYNFNSHQLPIEGENVDIPLILEKFTSFKKSQQDDQFPSMLCLECSNQLGQCYAFLKKIEKSDEQISKLMSLIDKNDVDTLSEEGQYEAEDYLDEDLQMNNPEEEFKETEYRQADEIVVEQITTAGTQTSPSMSQETTLSKRCRAKRKPVFALTENVASILTHVRKYSEEDETSIEQKPFTLKRKRERSPVKSLVVTKFKLAEPITEITASGTDETEDLQPPQVNQIRMLEMTAVEVDPSKKIKFELDEDMNIENPNTIYLCKYCPRAFSTSHYLLMHTKKSHVCQYCMKGFAREEDLFKHRRMEHTQFQCAVCKKDFSNSSNLRQHMRRLHNINLPAHVSLLAPNKMNTEEGSVSNTDEFCTKIFNKNIFKT